ncbi:MAG TPA: serine/threonine-protein kinase, partial [Thermoanaerobaculia bacterium]
MTLTAGTRLGPYEVLGPLGAGGMGEVYRARDTRLGRTVALKLLPAAFSSDAERLERFEREARAASALSHPAIVAVHDVGKAEAGPWIAMELVEGSSLREVLAPGPMPTRRLLALAATVADGLARAHEAGIVHRDLKPENVMISRDGHPKILDFGLAKMTEPIPGEQSRAPTRTSGGSQTGTGLVLGTVGYMSPEQAAGKAVDFRSDQFSFGAMLYEMVSGQRPFRRDTPAETLAAIIREEPEPLPADCPAPLSWIVERCLSKDPEERYSSTRDLAKDLARLRDGISDLVSRIGAKPARSRGGALVPWLIAVCLAVALAVTLPNSRSGTPRARPASFTIDVPPGTTYSSGEITTNMALAPDGRSIVLRVQEGNDAKLFLRRLDRVEALPIEGTQRAISPFWSPDSKFVGFFADAKLKKVPVEGGAVTTLCDAGPEGPGSWSARGTILFGQIQAVDPGIYAVSDTGGSPRLVTKSERPAVLLWPQWIDEGSKFLYLAVGLKTGHELRAFSLEKGDLGRVTGARILSRVELVAPNSLLYVQEGALLAQRFESRALRLEGEPLVLAQGVHYFWGPGNAGFSGSQTGIAAWEPYRPRSRIAVLDRQGRPVGPPGEVTEAVFSLRLSPDGTRLAYDLREPRFGTWDIWIRDLERGISTRLTTQPDDEK